jgi:hypothetical protein
VSELDELRTLIREVIRDVLPKGLLAVETVNLFTDEDLAAFASRLLDLDPETREELREDLRAGRKRFRLAAPQAPQTPQNLQAPQHPQTPQNLQAPQHPQTQQASQAPPGVRSSSPPGSAGTQGANGLTAVNGSAGSPARRIERGAVTEKVVRDAARAGERLVLGRGAVLTPLARDRARASGVEITKEGHSESR